jgi:NAD(P)-dependent dehydrogenase (short-subunit alcohol dehydrogenase family)
MELELSGKAALVTGASRGIGRAIARALLSEGCRIALNARNPSDLLAAARDLGGVVAVAGDMTSPVDARRVIEEATAALGKLDVLVCNVGSGRSVAPGMETAEEWQRVFATNLWSTTNAVEAARTALAASHGVVVCISSICGLEVVAGAPVTYSAAKAALHAYVRGIARPLGAQGVRINAIAPGNIAFDGSVWQKRMAEDAFGVQQILERDVALSRLGTAEEVASLAVYLASPRSEFATGGIWRLDGGQTRA